MNQSNGGSHWWCAYLRANRDLKPDYRPETESKFRAATKLPHFVSVRFLSTRFSFAAFAITHTQRRYISAAMRRLVFLFSCCAFVFFLSMSKSMPEGVTKEKPQYVVCRNLRAIGNGCRLFVFYSSYFIWFQRFVRSLLCVDFMLFSVAKFSFALIFLFGFCLSSKHLFSHCHNKAIESNAFSFALTVILCWRLPTIFVVFFCSVHLRVRYEWMRFGDWQIVLTIYVIVRFDRFACVMLYRCNRCGRQHYRRTTNCRFTFSCATFFSWSSCLLFLPSTNPQRSTWFRRIAYKNCSFFLVFFLALSFFIVIVE